MKTLLFFGLFVIASGLTILAKSNLEWGGKLEHKLIMPSTKFCTKPSDELTPKNSKKANARFTMQTGNWTNKQKMVELKQDIARLSEQVESAKSLK